ncbi:Pentafunctional AROM polypeptide [Includes: 3-dehydroquinate synthase (DHQS) [Durusdinium trenchii]|uniref:shikimate kinase n=1 Tax=Durusdinium trenchii TaxID=1381693 RepID=A0ABP0KSU7_9DINO
MEASVVVIGMRGAGKSTLGRVGGGALGWAVLDMDEVLENKAGMACGDIVAKHGWPGFRAQELAALQEVLRDNPTRTVVSCGGGIVETEPARELLAAYAQDTGPVVFVDRHIDDIAKDLAAKTQAKANELDAAETEARRPQYGESVEDVYARRLPHFETCCSHRFPMVRGEQDWAFVSNCFEWVLRSLYAPVMPSPLDAGARLAHYDSPTVEEGCDGVWVCNASKDSLPNDVAKVRRSVRCLPLVLDAGGDVQLALAAAALGVECVVLDSIHLVEQVIAKRGGPNRLAVTTRLGVRFAVSEGPLPQGVVDAVDLVCLTVDTPLVDAVEACRAFSNVTGKGVSVMVEDVSAASRASELLEALMLSHGPGFGPRIDRLATLRKSIGSREVHHYCLIGGAIRSSPSPAMHNAGFQALRLPKRYTLCETFDFERIKTTVRSKRFRGASVTMPHKEAVQPLLDSTSEAADAIGAVNTIIVDDEDGTVCGDNTDWFGLHELCRRGLENTNADAKVALVVGAGGTALAACFCVQKLGLKLFVYNRTPEKAQRVATRFGGQALTDLTSLQAVDVIISTVPASSEFTMPDAALLERCKPVVVDAAYRPRQTALLIQAGAQGCATFEGIDMLVEQGLMQMHLWTGVPLAEMPRRPMEYAARNFYVDTDPGCERYYLFGHPISASPSPTLHNTGFQAIRATKLYALCESPEIAVVAAKLKEPSFRGASVTIPHKEAVVPLLASLTEAAQAIGAVNTIYRDADGNLCGDNTDWLGIRALLASASRVTPNGGKALVVGAGGTALAACYCAVQMGLELVVHNRSHDKAARLAARFGGTAVADIAQIPPVDCIISTVPATAGFEAPQHLLANTPAVVDVAYRPRRTKLLQQAQKHGCETFEGIQMLIEQGIEQFRRWTGVDAPRNAIESAVFEFYNNLSQ